jgi:hypothetical protein
MRSFWFAIVSVAIFCGGCCTEVAHAIDPNRSVSSCRQDQGCNRRPNQCEPVRRPAVRDGVRDHVLHQRGTPYCPSGVCVRRRDHSEVSLELGWFLAIGPGHTTVFVHPRLAPYAPFYAPSDGRCVVRQHPVRRFPQRPKSPAVRPKKSTPDVRRSPRVVNPKRVPPCPNGRCPRR